MVKNAQNDGLKEFSQTVSREAFDMLSRPYGAPCAQLQLFDGFHEQKPERKGKNKWDFQDEILAQALARGYCKTEAYRISHPEAKTQNLNTLYPNASRACGRSKVIARVEEIKKELEAKALMSTAEFFSILNDLARNPSKNGERSAALKMIGQIKGVFQAEKGLPGADGTPLIVRWDTPKEGDK